MDRFQQFKWLYKTFMEGSHWMRAHGKDATQQDRDDFQEKVVVPMEDLWATFTDGEKAEWDQIKAMIEMVDGTLVLPNEPKIERRKTWRKYSRSY